MFQIEPFSLYENLIYYKHARGHLFAICKNAVEAARASQQNESLARRELAAKVVALPESRTLNDNPNQTLTVGGSRTATRVRLGLFGDRHYVQEEAVASNRRRWPATAASMAGL
jgi:hypothetical protein